ncbi:Uncharacterised protein [Chryseobacterium indoltheticum]|uniref:Uncharacterized protein n=1 Tax=Chryseobacterium indoltheticum TaxID=254 RepID=A0A381FDT7_9FLAO|nr:Uncharacterised protein [Chryseobacterium indoltheticum]
MKKRNLFSNDFVDIVSKMLTLFMVFIYAIIIFNISISTKPVRFIFIVFLLSISVLQFYFFIIKNRKGIILTNLHLCIMLGFVAYGLIKDLIINRFYTSDTNGLIFFIFIISLSIFIVNKYKSSTIEYSDLDELGKKHD